MLKDNLPERITHTDKHTHTHTRLADVGSRFEDTSERCSKGHVWEDVAKTSAVGWRFGSRGDGCETYVLFGRVFFNLSRTC